MLAFGRSRRLRAARQDGSETAPGDRRPDARSRARRVPPARCGRHFGRRHLRAEHRACRAIRGAASHRSRAALHGSRRRCSIRSSRRPWPRSDRSTTISRWCRRRRRAASTSWSKSRSRSASSTPAQFRRSPAKHRIHVLTNYETSWYPTTHAAFDIAVTRGELGQDSQGRRARRASRTQGDRRQSRVPRVADRSREERRRRADRLRLLRRGSHHLADEGRRADVGLGGHAAAQAADLSEGGRRGDDRRDVSGRAGHHSGVLELADWPEGHGGLRRDGSDRDRGRQASCAFVARSRSPAEEPNASAAHRSRWTIRSSIFAAVVSGRSRSTIRISPRCRSTSRS